MPSGEMGSNRNFLFLAAVGGPHGWKKELMHDYQMARRPIQHRHSYVPRG